MGERKKRVESESQRSGCSEGGVLGLTPCALNLAC